MSAWQLPESYRSGSGTVRWNRLGVPDGRPLVLLHGTPFSSYVWRAVARSLARDHQVFVWDMPGYGLSEKFPGQDVSLAAQGRVFTELLDHWGLAEPLVVAHDFGGAVALRAHLLHDARYRALALVDPVALAPWGSPFFRLVREHAEVFGSCPRRSTGRWCASTWLPRAVPDCTRRCWTSSSGPGSASRGSRPSTGRSPRRSSGTPTRSRTGIPGSAYRR
ncbi:alpha/beta fold hydrolase [Streptomyces sp. WAC 04229]|uniref:alpha/beta fold hydrolase n=1 Tax=Streptomyces sp. WAC 04229 TaxID=2203206 RepID=UPI0021AD8E0D|nr:alpha/beta fold hydrolase [Streptomyces sp. WAC 04229]